MITHLRSNIYKYIYIYHQTNQAWQQTLNSKSMFGDQTTILSDNKHYTSHVCQNKKCVGHISIRSQNHLSIVPIGRLLGSCDRWFSRGWSRSWSPVGSGNGFSPTWKRRRPNRPLRGTAKRSPQKDRWVFLGAVLKCFFLLICVFVYWLHWWYFTLLNDCFKVLTCLT